MIRTESQFFVFSSLVVNLRRLTVFFLFVHQSPAHLYSLHPKIQISKPPVCVNVFWFWGFWGEFSIVWLEAMLRIRWFWKFKKKIKSLQSNGKMVSVLVCGGQLWDIWQYLATEEWTLAKILIDTGTRHVSS